MRDIQMVLDRWGAWAASDSSGVDYSPIAAGFKGLLPYTSKTRQACSDSDALIIEGCLALLKKRKPYEHSLIVAHYLYGGNDSNLLIVFYVQIMPDDFVMQLHRF